MFCAVRVQIQMKGLEKVRTFCKQFRKKESILLPIKVKIVFPCTCQFMLCAS